ncbi:hypothetical protein KKF34_07180 [Myxococcota bacterium]|nr:hypothetical protein [Myxococcota bacterium]MBU1382248.1 hypothetical protein [Myxococcota bacterium]MBU1496645.1 hypothetical protein [Myxococcota bacterium]
MKPIGYVMSAINGKTEDRRAFTMLLSLYGARLTDCDPELYFSDPQKYLQGQIAVFDAFTPDIIFSPFALAFETKRFGTTLIFPGKYPPNIKKPSSLSVSEIIKTFPASPSEDPAIKYMVSCVKLLKNHFGDDVPICSPIVSCTDLPAMVLGIEAWIDLLISDPDTASAFLEFTTAHFKAYSDMLFEAGSSFLVVPSGFTNPQLMYPGLIENVCLKALEESFSKLKGPAVLHHGGTRFDFLFEKPFSLPNMAGVLIDSKDSFSKARSSVPTGTLLIGNFQGPMLNARDPDFIINSIQKILENRKDDPHFIFCTSGADVPWDTPYENLKIVSDFFTKAHR